MLTDIEISQEATLKPITEIAADLGFTPNDLENYGAYKAKVSYDACARAAENPFGHLILVTSINPTAAGEGKSTVTVGLGDAFNQLGQKTAIALREPSMGPVMGMKGGATGGGYAQVLPMEDINLHFTGDMHAITSANNALSALIDNHLQQGNALQIDPRRILWKRVLDVNDRALRQVTIGLGGPVNGIPREDGFDITVASEIMAILCLATSLEDLKKRLGQIVFGYNYQREPLTVADLHVEGALALILKDALKPNLVQTIYGTPAFVHGGPFANIAHGCNSVMATRLALQTADIAVTEAGFGADLGGEKFLDIKVPTLGKVPDAVVIVATIRALKMHGGLKKTELKNEDVTALQQGFANLAKHIENIQQYGLPVVVAINQFVTDTEAEITCLKELCQKRHVPCALTSVWENGPAGGIELAQALLKEMDNTPHHFTHPYAPQASLEEKAQAIVQKIYGGKEIILGKKARNQLKVFQAYGWDRLPVCMAKTQYSFSDDPKRLGRPTDFSVTIREFVPKIGASFIVALTGDILTMPGLPKVPNALNMDVTADGKAQGLF